METQVRRPSVDRIIAALWELLVPVEPVARQDPSKESDADFYAALLSHYLHQDLMLWSRVQLLVAIQAGVLTSAFGLRTNGRLAAAILALGASLTILLFFLILKDEIDRDVNLPLLDLLAARLAAGLPSQGTGSPVRLAVQKRPWYIPIRGHQILRTSILLLLIIDLALAVSFVAAPAETASALRP